MARGVIQAGLDLKMLLTLEKNDDQKVSATVDLSAALHHRIYPEPICIRLTWFIETCWQLPLAAIAEGLRQHRRITSPRKTLKVL